MCINGVQILDKYVICYHTCDFLLRVYFNCSNNIEMSQIRENNTRLNSDGNSVKS